ncbi:MAG: hypothetical protein CM15mP98_04030 [Paracoccaceae bacterium]|nr:MAG: hypothetical protein CM15mP98_04030 [Paracoccaceae bacterium]
MLSIFDQNRTTILIPMRALNEGKSRLSSFLSPNSRARLVELLFSQLLKKLNTLKIEDTFIFSKVVVITPCEKVKKYLRNLVLLYSRRLSSNGLNSALKLRMSWSLENRYDSSLIIPGDLIDPNADDIKNFKDGKKIKESMIICPSTDFGTNALFLPIPTKFNLKFGHNSFLNIRRKRIEFL